MSSQTFLDNNFRTDYHCDILMHAGISLIESDKITVLYLKKYSVYTVLEEHYGHYTL